MNDQTGIDFLQEWNPASKLMYLSAVVPGRLHDAIVESVGEDLTPLQFLDNLATVGMIELAQKMIEPWVRQTALYEAEDKGEMRVRLALSLFHGLTDKKVYESTFAWKSGEKYWVLSEEFLAGTPFENYESFSQYLDKMGQEDSA